MTWEYDPEECSEWLPATLEGWVRRILGFFTNDIPCTTTKCVQCVHATIASHGQSNSDLGRADSCQDPG